MSKTIVSTTNNDEINSNEQFDKVKSFWSKHKKSITIFLLIIVLGLGGWICYKKFYKEPREIKANEAIIQAEDLFNKMAASSFGADTVKIVIDGGTFEGEKVIGLKKIIKDFDGTAAANRSKFMIGAISLHTKKFDDAIKYLKDFKSNGASQIETKCLIMLGDAHAEKNLKEEAYNYYKKAALVNEKDDATTPDALYRSALYAEFLGKNQDAIDSYKKIKEKYPNYSGVNNGEIDKALARLSVLN
jgi:predicted negative regulator of RcsB-dependent stress response